jgi:hypothetical protein
MVWLTDGESLINVVIDNKPKMLRGLPKQGTWLVQEVKVLLTQIRKPPAERRSLTHIRYSCGTW